MLSHFILLLVFQLIGEVTVVATELPLPGPVVGMVLLFVFLFFAGDVSDQLERVSSSLLSNLSLLFVPAGVGIMLHAKVINVHFVPIAISLVVSTFLTILVTGAVMHRLNRGTSEQ